MTDIEKTIIVAQTITNAMNLEGYYPDPYSSVRIAANSMERGLTIKDDRQVVGPQNSDHESLVEYIGSDDIAAWCIQRFVANSQKIHAIKVLRSVAGVGLKEAKEAVEAYVFRNADRY